MNGAPNVVHLAARSRHCWQSNVLWEGGKRGMFELYSSAQHVHFCCRLSGNDMNMLIDIAAEFDCPLYDPQEDRRFDGRVA